MADIAIIPGDGIGVEVTREAVRVLDTLAARGLPIRHQTFDFGAERYLRTGSAITAAEIESLGAFDAMFLGAIGDPRVADHAHARAILLGLRFHFDLYINLRPARLIDPRLSPLRSADREPIDLVIFRENTEGPYAGMGGRLRPGTADEIAIEEDINTHRGVERIIRAAFEYAMRTGRRRVTLTDKANAMPNAGALWRRVFAHVGDDFPAVECEAVYADALALDLVRRPARYQVIVAPNLFGDLLSDLTAALVGGLGLAPSANLHPGRPGLFEPVHGSAPDLAGKGVANPIAAILTVALMLSELGFDQEAERVTRAVETAVRAGRTTPDLGGASSTSEVGEGICAQIA
ncbi:MAG: isocitrate/isopropylmalate dehydrogenase family protein [Gemmatimonadetes bacterium]|nr:isocitrate/isopropylmalate dehydrogenase family protein [Gemmatimonadota bacterium]